MSSGQAVHFWTYLLIFRSLIEVRSQNQDRTTAYDIRHDLSQNQRSESLDFSSMFNTSLLTDLFLLYSILNNDIHDGTCEQDFASKIRTCPRSINTKSMVEATKNL